MEPFNFSLKIATFTDQFPPPVLESQPMRDFAAAANKHSF
jgi:hypothetical protein